MIFCPPPFFEDKGQASVFVLAMLGVIVVSVVFLYQAGRITTEKMQLQNGADASAFTAAALEARAMNFSAYTNRAMVANEIAIGQAVGLLSFAVELKSVRAFINTYAAIIEAASLGAAAPITAPMRTIAGGFGAVGDAMEKAVGAVAPIWIRAFSIVNTVYSITQTIYHYTTALLVMDGIPKSLQTNVVGTNYGTNLFKNLFVSAKENARLGKVSLAMLAGHFYTYLNGYTKRYKQSKKEIALAEDGMARLAATVRTARDDFSSGVGTNNRNWEFTLNGSLDLAIIAFSFRLGADSKGGTELVKKGDGFVWAGADTGAFVAEADLELGVEPLRYSVKVKLPGIPFGSGGYQAAGKTRHLSSFDLGGTTAASDPKAFGGAPDHKLSWPFAKMAVGLKKVKGGPYNGLKPYRDVKVGKKSKLEKMSFSFPFFLVAVERDYDQFMAEGPQFSDDFDLARDGDNFAKKIAAVAKSEVYFSRPTKLDYFKRRDGFEEGDNLFSPFWQARLVPTSDLDRILVLALQQKKIWLADADLKKLHSGVIERIVRGLESFLRLIP